MMFRIADLFCGAGGESTGIVQAVGAMGERYDLAAVNHWDIAMATHERNHPNARHFCASLEQLNPVEVFEARDKLDLLWASPECTHHSNARGGRPRSNQSRVSSWLVLKWLSELYVRRVIIENVPEFVNWGPLGANGMPMISRRGATFEAFVAALRSLGYRVEWQVLCAADYGDPTTRRRFFLQAVRGTGRIEWPAHTHTEQPGLFGAQPWIPAREIIDWSIRGESIVNRRRPLAPATLRRIESGIRKYWGEWAEPFLVVLRGTGDTRPIGRPLPAVTAGGNHLGLVQPFLVPFYGERRGQTPRTHGVTDPVPTIPASASKFGVVEPFVLHQFTPGRPRSINEPVPTVTAKSGHGLVEPFLIHYYGTAGAEPIRIPLATVTTRDRFALIEGSAALDITFRMLQPHELARAQGFPLEYWFAGGRTDQVRQIGNAVPVNTARALALSALGAA